MITVEYSGNQQDKAKGITPIVVQVAYVSVER